MSTCPNLARPVGNVTGVTLFFGETGPKRLQILTELIPDAKSIGILVNPRNPSSSEDASEIARAATSMGTPCLAFRATNASELEVAFSALSEQRTTAIIITDDPFFFSARDQLVASAARHS